jgi:hypothetical protein
LDHKGGAGYRLAGLCDGLLQKAPPSGPALNLLASTPKQAG